MVIDKNYTVFSNVQQLQWIDLWSGGDTDPLPRCISDVMGMLCQMGVVGNLYYSTRVSIFGQADVDREKMLFEDKDLMSRRIDQMIQIDVIVFRDFKEYLQFEHKGELQ